MVVQGKDKAVSFFYQSESTSLLETHEIQYFWTSQMSYIFIPIKWEAFSTRS